MINLYTDLSLIQNLQKINDVESYFSMIILKEKFLNKEYTEIMKSIDNIKNRKGSFIETPFGKTSIDNLSTGCKTALLCKLNRNKNIAINITECGANALKEIFKHSKEENIILFTKIPLHVYGNEKIECILNNKIKVNTLNELYERLIV